MHGQLFGTNSARDVQLPSLLTTDGLPVMPPLPNGDGPQRAVGRWIRRGSFPPARVMPLTRAQVDAAVVGDEGLRAHDLALRREVAVVERGCR